MVLRALPHRSPHLSLLLACSLLAGIVRGQQDAGPSLKTPAPAVKLQPEVVPGSASHACAGCHAEVTAEWAASAHGLAWVDEVYRSQAAEKRQPELCYGCHAPEPLLAGVLGGKPETRAAARETGVDCDSCHTDETGAMHGPRGTSVAAHPSKLSEHMTAPGSNALCSACHATNIGPVIGIAKDFATAKLAERGLSCVGCHMAAVERAWATDAPARVGRSHSLQTPRDPAFLRLAFAVAHRSGGGTSSVVLRNQAGHRVPGLIGRRLSFQAELLDEGGKVLETKALTIDERAYLPVQGTREIAFSRSGKSVRLRGLHQDPRSKDAVAFLDETLVAE